MSWSQELAVLGAFNNAAARVPAYRQLLRESGIQAEEIKSWRDFQRLPILQKQSTFARFDISELCVEGIFGKPGAVLTSSGHSGIFAFGVTDSAALEFAAQWIDDSLDYLFAIRTRPTLLINCLPMGVKVPTRACTLAETSVRADMVIGLVKSMGHHFAQLIVVGEAAFVKHLLETGQRQGIDWKKHLVQVILGEEPLAENARSYLGGLLGHTFQEPHKGVVVSSMGIAEVGLNLFFEMPPGSHLISLRRLLHDDATLRESVLGKGEWVPSLFTYDPQRLLVEFDSEERLIVTTLDPRLKIPLIRYSPGDQGKFVTLPSHLQEAIEANGISWDILTAVPLAAIFGRGTYVTGGGERIYPEAVKEGVYLNAKLAGKTTANFRLVSGETAAEIRVQLSPGVSGNSVLDHDFHAAIAHYVKAPFRVTCKEYETFQGGMELDYERKFRYIEA